VSAKTKGDAERALRQAMTDADRGLFFHAGTLTVEEYMVRWLADSVRGTVRSTTFERYEQITGKHIVPEVGRVKLKALTPVHVRSLYRKKLEAGLSARTVQYVHVTLHKALKQAVRDGLIPRNSTEAVKPPQLRREEMRPLTAEQVKILFDAAKGDRLEALYILAVTTGLRQGELLGLKWDDVDLDTGTLQVRRTLTTAKDGPVLSAPKTKGSRRSVKLSKRTLEALRSHLERQLREIDRLAPVARERPHIRLGDRRAAKAPLHHHAPLQALAQAGGAAADPLPRPPAHVRHAALVQERQPQDSLGDVRARHHSHHAGYLQPCAPHHAGERCKGDGRGPFVGYCCPTAGKAPGSSSGGSSLSLTFCARLQGFLSVGAVGLEPTWPCGLRILSPVRLPIPPRP
jgi:integrase